MEINPYLRFHQVYPKCLIQPPFPDTRKIIEVLFFLLIVLPRAKPIIRGEAGMRIPARKVIPRMGSQDLTPKEQTGAE
jgi:hypothetical protein